MASSKVNEKTGGFDMDKIMSLVENEKDAREIILKEFAGMLFDEEKLLMISHLTQEFQFELVKLCIIRNYYDGYYSNLEVTNTIKPIKDFPYYEIIIDENEGNANIYRRKAYDRFIKELLMTTISLDARGRDDIKGIITRMNDDLDKQEIEGMKFGVEK